MRTRGGRPVISINCPPTARAHTHTHTLDCINLPTICRVASQPHSRCAALARVEQLAQPPPPPKPTKSPACTACPPIRCACAPLCSFLWGKLSLRWFICNMLRTPERRPHSRASLRIINYNARINAPATRIRTLKTNHSNLVKLITYRTRPKCAMVHSPDWL